MAKMLSLRSEAEIMSSWVGSPEIPTVSICCITYNHELYISEAIESFLNQRTHFPFEIVIHDDASTDNTKVLIEGYQKRYPRLIRACFQEENQYRDFPAKPLMTALEMCKGKYIAMCEGDDFFTTSEKLVLGINKLETDSALTLVFGPALQQSSFDQNPIIRNIYSESQIEKINLNWIVKAGGGFFPTATAIIRASVLKQMPDWFGRHSTGDYPLAILCGLKGKIGYIPDVTACYRVHDQSHTHQRYACKRECVEIIQRKKLMNLNFLIGIRDEGLISEEIAGQLIEKERYIYFSKGIDCGLGLWDLRSALQSDLSTYFLLRLVAKFFRRFFRLSY